MEHRIAVGAMVAAGARAIEHHPFETIAEMRRDGRMQLDQHGIIDWQYWCGVLHGSKIDAAARL